MKKVSIPDKYRILIAAAVLVAALAAGWWLNREAEPEAPPRTMAPAGGTLTPQPSKPLPPAQKAENAPPAQTVDIFAVHTWEPPPPPVTAAAPAPAQAPPLPFRFMGRIAEPGKPPVFLLLENDRVLRAKPGDRIGGNYRLEKFEAGQLYFRYRPMNVVQILPVGNAQ